MAELGSGIYVKSGDAICMGELSGDSADASVSFVSFGGGFAVLQENTASTIRIEKVTRRQRAGHTLIKSGDTVRFRLETVSAQNVVETKYLSIHRGWWLKWVSTEPSKNGNFTIYTHESEFSGQSPSKSMVPSDETQSSHLTFGGTFWLRHRRWSKFQVGVSREGSATYGGRLLGLVNRKDKLGSSELAPAIAVDYSEEGDALVSEPESATDEDLRAPSGKNQREWMRPIQFRVYEAAEASPAVVNADKVEVESGPVALDDLVDVPVWLEIMNRTERVRQMAFAVRVMKSDIVQSVMASPTPNAPSGENYEQKVTMRIRSGAELAPVVRQGLNNLHSMSPAKRQASDDALIESTPVRNLWASPVSPGSPMSRKLSWTDLDYLGKSSQHGRDRLADLGPPLPPLRSSSAHGFERSSSDVVNVKYDELNDVRQSSAHSVGELDDVGSRVSLSDFESDEMDEMFLLGDEGEAPKSPTKKGKFPRIGKLAQSVKNRTSSTSKSVVRRSVKVGKGTVSAGKAIIAPIRPKNPPLKEPKSMPSGRKARRDREKGLHIPIGRSMRRSKRRRLNPESLVFLAGELSPSEQSCRTVSSALFRISATASEDSVARQLRSQLHSILHKELAQDSRFLSGGAMDLGVVYTKKVKSKLLADSVVARCLWESHWREEWCGVFEAGVFLFAPLTSVPCIELSFEDIDVVRQLDYDDFVPLPQRPVLVIETAWLCHYIAFPDMASLTNVEKCILDLVAKVSDRSVPSVHSGDDLVKARFWQGFQSSLEPSLSLGRGKWADVLTSGKPSRRVVLNNRRMLFDLDRPDDSEVAFVERLLERSLNFSLEPMSTDPDELVSFLNSASQLRTLSIRDMDLTRPTTFCLFVNLYHCLLQHALLLSIQGPLHKHNIAQFMRSSCYEIGGDVFSLAELNNCILRGSMSHAVGPKAPYIDAPKKSAAHRYYALGYTTPLINFVLNTADRSCSPEVVVFQRDYLDEQLERAAFDFLSRNLVVDSARRVIILPKICDVYRGDFGEEGSASIARYCADYMDEERAAAIRSLLDEGVSIRFQSSSDQYHATLRADRSAK